MSPKMYKYINNLISQSTLYFEENGENTKYLDHCHYHHYHCCYSTYYVLTPNIMFMFYYVLLKEVGQNMKRLISTLIKNS